MKKLVGGIVGIVALAAAGMTGAAYWSGLQAERWYEEALAEGSRSGDIKLSTVRYQRGLFSSQAVTRVEIARPDPDVPDPSFSIRQDIYHGPLPLAGRKTPDVPMEWTGAVVRATLDPESSDWTRQLAQWYGDREPVVALSKIAFDGASDTHITMPPLTLNEIEDVQSLEFSGLQGQFQVAAHATAVQGHLSVAGLEMIGTPEASGQVKLSDLTVTVDQRKGAFNLLFGESSFKIGELRVRDETTGAPLVMTNLSMTGSASQQDPKQVTGEMLIKVDQITADQRSGTGALRLTLRHLDGATAERLQQWQRKISSKPDDPQALNELLGLIKALLRNKPELILDTQAKMAEGDWRGQLTLNFQDFDGMGALQNPMSLLAALEKGQAEIDASKALVETLFTEILSEELQAQLERQDQSVDEKAVQNMAAAQAGQQLQQLMAAGFLRLEGDRYKATARFEKGKLLVNGQEIPFMPPVGLGGGAPGGNAPVKPGQP